MSCHDEAAHDDLLWQQIQSFKVTAIVTAGPYERTVGAERSFEVDQANAKLTPGRDGTVLRSSKRDAQSLHGYLRTMTEKNI